MSGARRCVLSSDGPVKYPKAAFVQGRVQGLLGKPNHCLLALTAMAYSVSACLTSADTPPNQTKVDEFVRSVGELPFLNPLFVQPMVLEDDWAGLLRVLNGRVTGLRTLHRSDAVVMRFTSTVDVHSMLEMGPLHGALSVILVPARVVGSPFANSPLYHNRRRFSFDVHTVVMNFSAGTDFESGKGRLHALSLQKIIGLNASIDEMDVYGGSIVNLFTYVLKRHAERCVRYVVENVLRSVMADTIRYADLSAEGLLRNFARIVK